MEFCDHLKAAINKTEIEINVERIDMLCRYHEIMMDWNKRLNLTRITDPCEAAVKHYVDSLMVKQLIEIRNGDKVFDVGTGPGFPGVPIKIADPSINLVLIESTKKKADYLQKALTQMNIEADVISERVEDIGKTRLYRGSADIAIARAVAPLSVLCEYCIPLIKVGGRLIAMKGPDSTDEVKMSTNALNKLYAEVDDIIKYSLPYNLGDRTLIVISKKEETPESYPRRTGIPKKNPL